MKRRQAVNPKEKGAQFMRLHTADIYGGMVQPRLREDETLPVLAQSIARHGMLQPVVVQENRENGRYMLVCGARRLAACRMLGLDEIDAVIELVDTLAASAGEGMAVYDAVARRDAGMPIEENAAYTRAHLQSYAHWFTVDDLHFLKRGGRCSPSAAFFGTMLKIKPVLHVDSEGRLIARSKVRGRMQALRAIAMKFGELGADKDQMVFISHGDCEKDAMVVKETLVKEFGCDPQRIILSAVGPVIGSHSGPGTVALFFRGRDRG